MDTRLVDTGRSGTRSGTRSGIRSGEIHGARYGRIFNTLRETGGPETQHQTSFPTFGCQLEDVFQLWCQLGHLFASFWGTFDGSKRLADQNGTRKHPGQKNVKFRPLEAPESYLPFSYFLERCRSKGCFLSMCFAGVVLYRICLDSWTPRTPIIRPKHCRIS